MRTPRFRFAAALLATSGLALCLPVVAAAQTADITGHVGPAFDSKSVDEWVRDLKHPAAEVRATAAFALAEGVEPQHTAKVLPALLVALTDPSWHVCEGAMAALVGLGEASVPGLLKLANHKRTDTRFAVARALGLLGPQAAAGAPSLINLLADDDAGVRAEAARSLGFIGGRAKAAVPSLVRVLRAYQPRQAAKHAPAETNPTACFVLGSLRALGVAAKPAPPFGFTHEATGFGAMVCGLAAIFNERDSCARLDLVAAFGQIGPSANAAVPALLPLLGEADAEVRRVTAETLGQIGWKGRGSARALRKLLKDSEPEVRAAAAQALGGFGRRAPAARPALLAALQDDDVRARVQAAYALWRLDRTQSVTVLTVLIAALKDTEPGECVAAARALGRMKGHALPAVPALLEALREQRAPAFVLRRCLRQIDPEVFGR